MKRGSGRLGVARILPDPLHHRQETVRALWRQMLFEMQPTEHGIGVDAENRIRRLARIEGEQDRDQAADDMGIAVADEAQMRARVLMIDARREPNLTDAAANLVCVGARAFPAGVAASGQAR